MNQRAIVNQISFLSDWELVSALSFCNKILDPSTVEELVESESICMFFFEGDEEMSKFMMSRIRDTYMKEFTKRRYN